jgi:hypothetical protein
MADQSVQLLEMAHSRGWVTSRVLSVVFGVHPRKIQRLSEHGELPFHVIKLGREYRYPLGELNRYLIEHGGEPLTDEDVARIEDGGE